MNDTMNDQFTRLAGLNGERRNWAHVSVAAWVHAVDAIEEGDINTARMWAFLADRAELMTSTSADFIARMLTPVEGWETPPRYLEKRGAALLNLCGASALKARATAKKALSNQSKQEHNPC